LRDELLNETLFDSRSHVREALAMWNEDYNTIRPHRGLGNLAPVVYAKLSAPLTQRDGALRYVGGSAQQFDAAGLTSLPFPTVFGDVRIQHFLGTTSRPFSSHLWPLDSKSWWMPPLCRSESSPDRAAAFQSSRTMRE
jgi:hypothetical protein